MAAHLLASKMIEDGVLQDAVEQQRKFFHRLVAIPFRQFKHGILNDIQSGVLISYGKSGMLEGSAFDTCQE